MRWTMPLLLCLLPITVGCSKPSQKGGDAKAQAPAGVVHQAPQDGAKEPAPANEFVAAQDPQAPPPRQNEKKVKAAPPRKIRYTADMRLIVADIVKAEEQLDAAITAAKGNLAHSETNSSANTVKTGTWKIRIPVEEFREFRKAVAKLGEIEKNTVDSEDMTDKYYDLEAHIKNRVAARDAMRDLLKETGKRDMAQYLVVYDKLEIINDEINRKEGQLRLWANLTDLTTLTVHLREKQKFSPDAPPELKEKGTFAERAGSTWSASWEMFVGFLQAIVILLIALAPWLVIPLVVVLAGALVLRRLVRGGKKA